MPHSRYLCQEKYRLYVKSSCLVSKSCLVWTASCSSNAFLSPSLAPQLPFLKDLLPPWSSTQWVFQRTQRWPKPKMSVQVLPSIQHGGHASMQAKLLPLVWLIQWNPALTTMCAEQWGREALPDSDERCLPMAIKRGIILISWSIKLSPSWTSNFIPQTWWR